MLGQQRLGVLPEQARSLLPLFLNRVASLPNPAANREACYFALLAHAWAHTCDRGHGTVEVTDDLAFQFFQQNHPEVTT